MTGIIPVDEEEDQEMYDDVGPQPEPDDEIYEELPGVTLKLLHPQTFITATVSVGPWDANISS